ncbi:DMT family transporter [Bacillus suaedae]|uniref:EamA family transporter n=1 Tax=Halalkalibacter suaedae TaxID=2822140 RepID=A0A941AM61_9BACI|nr:EamA family transporter [Bacillus suaedae]MBP3950140.1 EamA family transporter [Bacillus suaedae]
MRSYVFLIITMILFSGNILIGKAINDLPPVTITFVRCFIAFFILLPFSIKELRRNRDLYLREWKPLVGMSLTGIVLFNFFLYASLQYTTSTNVAVIEATTPVFAVVLGIIFLKERLNGLQYVGIVLSLVGALWVITKGSWAVLSQLQFNVGDLLVLVAIMAWTIYSLLIKQHNHKFPLIGSLVIMLFLATVVLLPFAALEWSSEILDLLNTERILGLLYLGIFPSVIALIFWNKGVAAIGPSRASVFLNLLPVFTIVGAVVFLEETVTFVQLIGGALVIGGVYLSTRETKASRVEIQEMKTGVTK